MKSLRQICFITAILSATGMARSGEPPRAEAFLHSGRLAAGVTELSAWLDQNPRDDEARFGLGAVQFIRAVERLGQALYRYGAGLQSANALAAQVPILRLPVPAHSNPERLTYELSRRILEEFLDDLTRSEKTLAAIRDGDVRLRIDLAPTRLDLDANGQADDPFRTILARYLGGPGAEAAGEAFVVTFDRGDVAWLRGYCHLLSALCEFALAHDGRELFDHTAHLFFANTGTGFGPIATDREYIEVAVLLDFVAMIHLLRLPVAEPQRMKSALTHFEQVFALSRESWKFILAETDDEREWLPNPRQQDGALGVPLSQQQIDGWLTFISEAEALFAGQRLAPFWRGRETRGINLRRVFTEPRTFDLVLWIQGSAAVPYLEAGTLTDREVWERLAGIFGGNFIGLALWFN